MKSAGRFDVGQLQGQLGDGDHLHVQHAVPFAVAQVVIDPIGQSIESVRIADVIIRLQADAETSSRSCATKKISETI